MLFLVSLRPRTSIDNTDVCRVMLESCHFNPDNGTVSLFVGEFEEAQKDTTDKLLARAAAALTTVEIRLSDLRALLAHVETETRLQADN